MLSSPRRPSVLRNALLFLSESITEGSPRLEVIRPLKKRFIVANCVVASIGAGIIVATEYSTRKRGELSPASLRLGGKQGLKPASARLLVLSVLSDNINLGRL